MKNPILKSISALLLAGILTLAVTPSASAKGKKATGGARPAFVKDSKTLGFSLGVGDAWTYYGSVHRSPAFAINYDQGILNDIGPGTIGVGGVIGYQTTYYDYNNNGYRARWTNFIVGVRGTYHLTLLKDKNNKFDPYGGVTIGIRAITYSDDYYNSINYHPYNYPATPFFGLFVGAKYNFTPHFGAFSELGYDISFFRIGLNANF